MLDDNSALRMRPELARDEVHVWRLALDRPAEEIAALGELLSAEERERAARYAFERDRARFIAGRGLLRCVLAACLGETPERVQLAYGPHGKPRLVVEEAGSDRGTEVPAHGTAGLKPDDAHAAGEVPQGTSIPARVRRQFTAVVAGGTLDLRFNLAHSEGLALLAVALGRDVGIDVEQVREEIRVEAIAGRYFSQEERAALAALPERERRRAFYSGWTRKEAYIKARGEGLALSLSLDGFTVSLAPGAEPALLSVAGQPDEPARWTLRDVEAGEGYTAAVCAEGAATVTMQGSL